MPRKPYPTALKLIKGNTSGRPLNKAEPKVTAGRPEPPEHMGADALAEWHRVVEDLYACGILTLIDRAALAAYCTSWGRWVEAERELVTARKATPEGESGLALNWRLAAVANKSMADVMRYAAEFGMTPSARSRIKAVPPAPNDDPAKKYLAG